MADVVVTARSVKPMPGTVRRDFVAGGAGNVGDVVYVMNDGRVAPSNAGAAGTVAGTIGIVVSAGSMGATAFVAGDALSVVLVGAVGGFSSLVPGTILFASNNAGKIADAAGTVSKKVGIAISTDKVLMALNV